MTQRLDHTPALVGNIIAFMPRRKRPKVRMAIRADFKLDDISLDNLLRPPMNNSARDVTQEGTDG